MLITGNQLRASRALAGLDQGELAKRASLTRSTVSAMEGKGSNQLGSGIDTIRAVMVALESAGVEAFVDEAGAPGCRIIPG